MLEQPAQHQVGVSQDAEQRIVDFVGHGGGQLAYGGHLFGSQQRLMYTLEFGGLAAHLFFDLGLNAPHLDGHTVEGARQVAQFVVGAGGQAIFEVSAGHPARAVNQLPDRPVHHHPDERRGRERTEEHGAHQEPGQGGLVLGDLSVHEGQR